MNPLFDGLKCNTRGHFAHCSYFSSPLRGAKYPRVLYVKPSNKVYIVFIVHTFLYMHLAFLYVSSLGQFGQFF